MIENIRTLPVEQVISGIGAVAQTARDADRELTLALTYAHRVMSPPLSLRVLSSACGLSPSTIRTRVHAPGVLEEVRGHIGESGNGSFPPPLESKQITDEPGGRA